MGFLAQLRSVVTRARRQLTDEQHLRQSWQRLRPALAYTTPEQIVRAAYEFHGRGLYRKIRPDQDPDELTQLVRRVQARAPRVIVDIGTRHGGTLFSWIRSNPQAELVISIDLPDGAPPERHRLFQRFVSDRPQTRLVCLSADSHAAATVATVRELLAGRRIDLLFLDGDHRFDGLRQDYELYMPLMRPGGMVAIHDICAVQPSHDVARFWQTVRVHHRYDEITSHARNHGYGLLLIDTNSENLSTAS